MDIYIIRHGAAAELDSEIAEESYRYLTIHGRNHCRIVAQRLKDLKVSFDSIISSPLVRAVQTAEVFAAVLKYEGEIKTAIELIGGMSFNRFLELIRRNSHHNCVGLVSHAPDVNTFSLNLISEKTNNLQLNFKNSSVCRICFDTKTGAGKCVWFLNSETMKLIEA